MVTVGEYKTRCGYKVVVSDIKLKNDAGDDVTFPVKGSIYFPTKGNKEKASYTIWQLDGKHNVFGDSRFDIMLEETI